MSLSRRQIIEAGAATGALGLMASSPLLAQVVRPSSPVPSPASPPLAVPARPRVMVDPVVDPRIVTRARAAFDRHRSRILHGDIVGIAQVAPEQDESGEFVTGRRGDQFARGLPPCEPRAQRLPCQLAKGFGYHDRSRCGSRRPGLAADRSRVYILRRRSHS